MEQSFSLEDKLISFCDGKTCTYWTTKHSVEGCFIVGSSGGGKSSGSGEFIAKRYLMKKFGGLVLTAKADEVDMWKSYCKVTGRENDLIIVEPGGNHHFNFLEYISAKRVAGIAITENIAKVLKTVIRSNKDKSGVGSDEIFWEQSLDMAVGFTIDLCLLAFGKVTVQKLNDIMVSAPRKGQASSEPTKEDSFEFVFNEAQKNVNTQIEQFEKSLTEEEKKKLRDGDAFEKAMIDAIPDARTLRRVAQFFLEQYKNLADKTRGIVDFYFTGFLNRLLNEPIYSLFCRHDSTFTPEDCFDGKIILLNLPVKIYNEAGRDAQILFKYIFQRAMEARNIEQNGRFVFLWSDESQAFMHELDSDFQATCRSSRIATVIITQNLPNLHANMGGNKSEYRVRSFLATLGTKFFHCNTDLETNRFASDLIGEGYIIDESRSNTVSGNFSSTEGESLKLEKRVRPEEFAYLKTGGPDNDLLVEAYVHIQGYKFADGLNFRKITFQQTKKQ